MELPLVVGIDGSEGSFTALDWAVAEAIRRGAHVHLVYASLWEAYEGPPAIPAPPPPGRELAERILAAAGERVRALTQDVKFTASVLTADTVPALLRESAGASLLVLGHRGRGSMPGLLLGTTALAVVARARCPVVVVRGGEPHRQGEHHRVVVGVGDAKESAQAALFAFAEAELRDRRLDAVHAWRCPERALPVHPHTIGGAADPHLRDAQWTLDRAIRGLAAEHPRIEVRQTVLEGRARDALLAEGATADLLVVGARPRAERQSGMQLGEVSHAVLHHAPCPVVVVPQRDPDAA
ncbi:universal stress protein [Streptomyces boninensis]|uniref:universal stress protein n=1 Tax=Streptomyces boninensis TaxID=2039455 RepID=UPI003B2102AC